MQNELAGQKQRGEHRNDRQQHDGEPGLESWRFVPNLIILVEIRIGHDSSVRLPGGRRYSLGIECVNWTRVAGAGLR
jgi:hypothetical protein